MCQTCVLESPPQKKIATGCVNRTNSKLTCNRHDEIGLFLKSIAISFSYKICLNMY